LLQIYLDVLGTIGTDITIDYKLNTPDDQKNILDDIEKNHKYVELKNLENINPPDELTQRFDFFVIPRLLDYKKRYELIPTDENIYKYYLDNINKFPKSDYIEGARILIETSPTMESDAFLLNEQLKNTKLSFREFAKEYYKSKGSEHDGYFGKINRGTIRDEIFEIFFHADSNAPFFGPVKTKHGILFGKLYAKYSEFEKIKNKIERQILSEEIQEYYDNLYLEEKKNHKVEILYDENLTKLPELSSVVYRFDGKDVKYSDVIKSQFYVLGDEQSIKFFKAIVERTIKNELLFSSRDASDLKKSTEYEFLFNAFLDQYRVYSVILKEYEKISFPESDLLNFYEKYKYELYKDSDLVKLIVVTLEKNPNGESDKLNIQLADKAAWNDIEELRNDFVKSATPQKFPFSEYNYIDGLKVAVFDYWQSVDDLGRIIGMDINENPEGHTSSVLGASNYYLFYHILERENRDFEPYNDIRDKVEKDYLLLRKQEIRKNLKIQ
jgi:hypothetical protein